MHPIDKKRMKGRDNAYSHQESYKEKALRLPCPLCSSRHKDVRNIIRDETTIGFVVTCCDCGYIMPHIIEKSDMDSIQSRRLLSILNSCSIELSHVRCGVPETQCWAKNCPCYEHRKRKSYNEYKPGKTPDYQGVYPEKYERDTLEDDKTTRQYL